MRRIYLTAVAVACMCTLHAEQTQTGNYVLSNLSVNIADFSSPIAAAEENWVLKSSVEKDGVTKEVFVIESEFGEIKKSKTVWKRSNGDFCEEVGHISEFLTEEQNRLNYSLKYSYTCPIGHKHTGTVDEEIQFPNGNIIKTKRTGGGLGCESNWYIGNVSKFFIASQEKEYTCEETNAHGIVGNFDQGYRINNIFYKINREDGSLRQKYYCGKSEFVAINSTDTIIECKEYKDEYGKDVTDFIYSNGDLVRRTTRSGQIITQLSIHRNGGVLKSDGRNNPIFVFPDGSVLQIKGFIEVKEGSSKRGYVCGAPEMLMADEIILPNGTLTKPDGTKEEYIFGKRKADLEAQAEAERAAKEKKEYDAMCQKFGKANVDKWNKDKELWVGMPVSLMKEVTINKVVQQTATATRYHIYNVMNQPRWSVWVSNGKITSIRVIN